MTNLIISNNKIIVAESSQVNIDLYTESSNITESHSTETILKITFCTSEEKELLIKLINNKELYNLEFKFPEMEHVSSLVFEECRLVECSSVNENAMFWKHGYSIVNLAYPEALSYLHKNDYITNFRGDVYKKRLS